MERKVPLVFILNRQRKTQGSGTPGHNPDQPSDRIVLDEEFIEEADLYYFQNKKSKLKRKAIKRSS